MFDFICPICHHDLDQDTCTHCAKNFTVNQGIPDFRTQNISEYSDTPLLTKIVLESKQNPWLGVVQKYTLDNPWLNQIITSQNRADFLFLLDLQDKTCLDIGCGWGQITEPLSSKCYKVFATDANPVKVEFTKIRCEQAGFINNQYFVSQTTKLPLLDNSIDVVFLIGVLEWIPDGFDSGDPREIQIQVLHEIKRILTKNGQLVIGIENSHGFKYFAGAPDDHAGIPYICYQDRTVANKIMQQKYHKDYRTYTYNLSGYKSLFQDAGYDLNKFQAFYPVKSYKDNQANLEINNLQNLSYLYQNILTQNIFNNFEAQAVAEELKLVKQNQLDEVAQKTSSYFLVIGK